MSDRFEKHARNVSLLTMISRVTGLARDAALSRIFGAGGVMDAFFFAFMIPNLFRRLFGEGALAAAFLPVYTKLHRDQPEVARQLASLAIGRLVVVLGVIVLVGELILFALSTVSGEHNLALWLMMVMLPYMPLVCAVALLGAMLHTHGRFGPTAAAPIVLNLCIITAAIGGGYWFAADGDAERSRLWHIGLVAGSVVLAGVLQLTWSLLALRNEPWWTKRTDDAREPMRDVLRQAGPMILGLGVLQLNTFFDGLIASYPVTVGNTIFGVSYPLEEGAMSAVSFAQRLYQFPLGVFGIAIATAIFPALARLSDDVDGFSQTLRRGLRLVIFIGLPASVGLMLVREPLAAVIYQGGAFSAESTERVSTILLGYAPAIWAYSMTHVLTRAFYARSDAKTPLRIAMGVVGLNLVLNCTLIWTPLREAGLAWSTSICAVVQTCLLLHCTRRYANELIERTVLSSWLRSGIASLVMAAAVLGVGAIMHTDSADWSEMLLRLAVLVGVGGAAVFAVAISLRMPELKWAAGGGAQIN